ncbi:MAG: hypothetical protein JWQ57_4327 [Mucilaginibacter sp.]|nr:hypothetical protein [Mucilaginibacter sp.]
MKNLNLLLLLSLLSLFAACKKDAKTITETPEKPDPLELATDSGSYTLNGKVYTLQSSGVVKILTTEPNLKVDSVGKLGNYISGNKDSVFFARSYTLFNTNERTVMEISFFKKYDKKDATKGPLGFYVPKDPLDLIHLGKYDFQVDYTRVNAHNGVAIDLFGNGQTFSNRSVSEPTQIKQESKNGSHFEVISFKPLKNGGALLEAKFNAVVFDKDEQPQKVTNGYIRMKIL